MSGDDESDHRVTKSSVMQRSIWGDPFAKKKDNEADLIQACSLGDQEKVENLLDKKVQKEQTPSANAKGLDEWTALHFAAEGNYTEIMIMLLDRKAEPNSKSTIERTPLHIACLRC